jgi:hypothetical protein
VKISRKITALAAVPVVALGLGLIAACSAGGSVPPGQPGASPPPTAACLKTGTCTAAQQQQVAAANGITNPAGLNGCLVVGNCTAAQQQGLAAGTSIGGSSSAPPPSSSATSGAGFTASCAVVPQYGQTGNSDPNVPSSTVLIGSYPEVTFNNPTSQDASVIGYSVTVIYFNASGDQLGTASVTAPAVVAAGQAVTTGTAAAEDGQAPTGAETCSVAPYQTQP